jgi:uncharacterized protein (UPF0332 family)
MTQEQKDLARHRYTVAEENYLAAKDLWEDGHFRDSVSRSYYAIFSAMRSLLALRSLDSRKHSGVIALFNQHFVKTGLVSKACSAIVKTARGARERSDYGDYEIVTKQEAAEQLKEARFLLDAVKKVLQQEIEVLSSLKC